MAPRPKKTIFNQPLLKPIPSDEWSEINRIAEIIGSFIYGTESNPKRPVVMPHRQECISLFKTEEDKKRAAKITNHLYFNGQYDVLRQKGYTPPIVVFKVYEYLAANGYSPSLAGKKINLFPGLYLPKINVSFANFSGSKWMVVPSTAQINTAGFKKQSDLRSITSMLHKMTSGETRGSLRIEDLFVKKTQRTIKQHKKARNNIPRITRTPKGPTLFQHGFILQPTEQKTSLTQETNSEQYVPSSVEERENTPPNWRNIPDTPPNGSDFFAKRGLSNTDSATVEDSQEFFGSQHRIYRA